MTSRAIICVDDEPIVLNALKDQLNRKFGPDYIIETTENGEDAIECMNEFLESGTKVLVVIADYIMPGMKGDTLLKKIHEISNETMTILLTGQASIEGVSNAINHANLYRYIAKPWSKDDLELTVKEAIKSFEFKHELDQKNRELTQLNTSLEKKVQQRTLELQELNATKDKFFSIIAHDLKNPFNVLIGFSDLLKQDYHQMGDEERLEIVEAMSEASEYSYKLLENLLEWSRSQTGRINYTPQLFDLKNIVTETIKLLESGAINKDIILLEAVAQNSMVFADPNMITTVIRNLVSNALKYTPNGGFVNIRSSKENNRMEITVTDSGIGIKKEDLNKLFRIDVHHSTEGTQKEQGTGLGLILCKEFVEKNDGEIWIESQPGFGSKFIFSLPISANE